MATGLGSVTRFWRGSCAALALVLLVAACDSIEDRVAAHYERAEALYADGATSKAVLEYRNALQLNADHAPSHMRMGEISEAKGDLQAAFRRYKRVTEIDRDDFAARVKVTRFLTLSNELTQAEESYAIAEAMRPEDIDVYILRAAISLRQDDLTVMRDALDRALAIDPKNSDASLLEVNYLLATSTEQAALARADQALATDPESFVLNTVRLQILQRIDDQPAVGDQLARMVQLYPDELRLLELQARWAVSEGEVDIAESALLSLALQQPKRREPAYDLVRYVRAQKGEAAGREALNGLIAQNEDPFELRLMLAQYEFDSDNVDLSLSMLADLQADEDVNKANRARISLARLLLRDGKREEGLAYVQEALKADRKEVEAIVLWSAHLLESEELSEADNMIRTGLNEAPDDIRLLMLSGQVHERLGNVDLATDRFAKAVRIRDYDPQIVQPYVQFLTRIGRDEAVATILSETNRKNPTDESILDQLGFVRAKIQDFEGATQIARLLEQTNPDRARQLRAAILIGQEKFDEGADLLKDLPEDERQRAASVAALVQTYIRNGEVDEAIAFLDGLLEENPANLQALGLRGNIHLAVGERDLAAELYQRILDADPGNSGARSALARMYQSNGDLAEAEAALVNGLEINPDNLFLKTRLAQFRELQGEFNSAIDLYTQVYASVPNSLLITNNLASLLADHRFDDPDAVERAYLMASRLRDSDYPYYRDTFGWTRYLRGEYELALEYIEPVIDALPGNGWVHYHLGMVYAALERPQDAIEHLQLSIELMAERDFPPRSLIEEKLSELRDS